MQFKFTEKLFGTKNFSPSFSLDTSEKHHRIHFYLNFTVSLNKKDFIPDHFKQLALEVINRISKSNMKFYTVGSKIETRRRVEFRRKELPHYLRFPI